MDSSFSIIDTFILLAVGLRINVMFIAPPEAPAILMARLCSESPLMSLVLMGDILMLFVVTVLYLRSTLPTYFGKKLLRQLSSAQTQTTRGLTLIVLGCHSVYRS